MKSWTLNVTEDKETGEYVLVFPPDLLKEAGWEAGDKLIWVDNKDGSWSLIKEELTSMIIEYKINYGKN